jgi:predicted secreted Zn-dependent protease
MSSAVECELRDFKTTTTITTSLPYWTTPAQASVETRERWRSFFVGLSEHEMGHARLALAAASEVGRSVTNRMKADTCETLRTRVNEIAERIMDEHRQKEKEYDRATAHGRIRPAEAQKGS